MKTPAVTSCPKRRKKEDTMDPANITSLNLAEVRAADDEKVRWTGAFFDYGGAGASQSATIYFEIAPGERLGGHTDTTEEAQFIVGGSGEIVLGEGTRPVAAGDLVNTGTEALQVIGFFAAPAVNQYWDMVMLPSNTRVTGSPNAPES